MIRININQQKGNRLGHIVFSSCIIYLYRIHLLKSAPVLIENFVLFEPVAIFICVLLNQTFSSFHYVNRSFTLGTIEYMFSLLFCIKRRCRIFYNSMGPMLSLSYFHFKKKTRWSRLKWFEPTLDIFSSVYHMMVQNTGIV